WEPSLHGIGPFWVLSPYDPLTACRCREPNSPCAVHLATTPCRRAQCCMKAPDRSSKPANGKTVLVLDDDVLVRMPVVQFLRDCGYRVVEAASTDEAIVILQKTNIPVDVVMSEIDIRGSMNGFGFA